MIRASVFLAAAALAVPLASHADPSSEPTPNFCYGCQQLGLTVGSGFGVEIFGGDHYDVDQTRILQVAPRWSIGLSDLLARGDFYEGNLEIGLEPLLMLNYDPRDGWVAGGRLLLHYNFLGARSSWVPFIEGAGGGSYMKFRLRGQADGFTYPLELSLGTHWLTSARTAVSASIAYYHLSNAGRELPNLGINGVMVKLGFTGFPSF